MKKSVRKIDKILLTNQLYDKHTSSIQRYQKKAFGSASFAKLIRYEFSILFCGSMPGALGYFLRRHFYQNWISEVGKGLVIGMGVSLRHPLNIRFGNNVAIDDNVLLDAAGAGTGGIHIGNNVIVSRNCVVQGKSGPVAIASGCDIGCNTVITSVGGVRLERFVLIAGNCYIGGGRYFMDNPSLPIIEQGIYSKGPVIVGKGTWIGAGVIILDGIRIGKGCVVAAGAVVTKDIPDYCVAGGVPAKIIRSVDGDNLKKTIE